MPVTRWTYRILPYHFGILYNSIIWHVIILLQYPFVIHSCSYRLLCAVGSNRVPHLSYLLSTVLVSLAYSTHTVISSFDNPLIPYHFPYLLNLICILSSLYSTLPNALFCSILGSGVWSILFPISSYSTSLDTVTSSQLQYLECSLDARLGNGRALEDQPERALSDLPSYLKQIALVINHRGLR